MAVSKKTVVAVFWNNRFENFMVMLLTALQCTVTFLLKKCVMFALTSSLTWNLLKNERPTSCHLLFYFTSYARSMFRTLIYPSSGACDCVVELPHRSFCSQFVVCWRFGVAMLSSARVAG